MGDELRQIHVVLDVPELTGYPSQPSVVVRWLLEHFELARQFLENIFNNSTKSTGVKTFNVSQVKEYLFIYLQPTWNFECTSVS